MTTIASLLVTIGADISELSSGLTDAENQINTFAGRMSTAVENAGASLIRTGAALDTLGAPIRQIGAFGLDTAADFESAMAEIGARTGLVGADLQRVSDFAIQMGADTSFSSQQAAEAFLQLLSSGQSAEEAISTLPSILDAAAASGEDLGRTADVITDIMASFGIDIEYAGDVVDTLAQAAGASSADMASLGQGFANVGGVAKSFGLNVQDTASILAIFAENGIKGAEAGTNLKSMLLNMSRDTEDTQAAWKTLGLSMYDTEGNMRDFETIISELDAALDGLPVEEQNKLMKDLGGSYGILGLTALRGSISISTMRDNMLKQAGAHEVAQARMDTFKGTVDSLLGSFEALMIVGLTPLMENFLTPLADQLIEVTNAVTMWASENPELASTIAVIAGIIGVAGPALVALGTAMTLAAPAVGVLAAALGVLVSPVALIAAGIAGLAVLASQFIDFTALGESIKTGITNAINSVNNIDTSGLTTLATTVKDAANAAFETAVATGMGVGKTLVEAVNQDIELSLPDIRINPDAIVPAILGAIADGLVALDATAISPPIDAFIDRFSIAFSGAVANNDFSYVGIEFQNSISDGFETLDFSGIQPTIDTHFNDILGTIVSVAGIVFGGPVGAVIGGASLVSRAIENDFLGIGTFLNESGISTAVNDALNSVKATIDTVIQSVFGGGQQGPQEAPAFSFQNMLPEGGQAMSGPLGTFVSDLKTGLAALQEIAGNIWENISPGLTAMGDGIKGFFENLSTADTDGLLRVVTVIGGAIGGILAKVLEFGSAVIGDAMTKIGDALPELGSFIAGIISAISDIGEGNWSEVLPDLGQAFIDFGQGILDMAGIELEIPDFQTAIDGWMSFRDSVITIVEFMANSIAVSLRTIGRDIDEGVLRIRTAKEDLALALNPGDTIAAENRANFILQIQGIESAENLEQQIRDSMAAGNLSIDISEFTTADPAAIAAKIADPVLIQNALNTALTEGDTAMFDVLAPIAMQLGIDTEDLVRQFNEAAAAAAAAANPSVSVAAAVTVNPASIDVAPLMAGILAATSMLPGPGGGLAAAAAQVGSGVPHLDTGGYIQSSGLAMVHAGEVVLNPSQQQGARGGGNTVNIYSNDATQVVNDLKREGIDLRAMAGA